SINSRILDSSGGVGHERAAYTTATAMIAAAATMASPSPVDDAFSMRCVSLLSGDADTRHHSSQLVLEDVAGEHPVTWVIGDEGNLDRLLRIHHHRVLPFAVPCRLSVAIEHAKAVAMQVDRVVPAGFVD